MAPKVKPVFSFMVGRVRALRRALWLPFCLALLGIYTCALVKLKRDVDTIEVSFPVPKAEDKCVYKYALS